MWLCFEQLLQLTNLFPYICIPGFLLRYFQWGCAIMTLFLWKENNSAKYSVVLSSALLSVLFTSFLPMWKTLFPPARSRLFASASSWVLFHFAFKPSPLWHREAEKREIKTCNLIWVHSAGWQISVAYSVIFKPVFKSIFYLCSMSLRPITIWSYVRDCTNPPNRMSDLPNWILL